MSDEIRGLMVDVIGHDCTAGGVTSGKKHAVLVWPGMTESDRVFAPRADMPLLEVEIDENPIGLRCGYLAVYDGGSTGFISSKHEPRIVRVLVKPAGKAHGSFGGHFVTTSDGRFPFSGPIPVFDRYER
jgi:hypothetical protein